MPEKNRFPAVLMPVSGEQRQWPAEVAPTLHAQFGDKLGLENQHIDSNAGGLFVPDMAPLPFDTTQVTSPSNYSNPKPGDPCHPLAARAHIPAVCLSQVDGGVSPTITAANNPSRSPQSSEVTAQVAAVLQAESARASVVCFEPGVASRDGGHVYYDVCGTIRREPGDNRMTVAFHPTQDPISSEDVCHSLSAGTKKGCSTAAAMYFTAAEVRHTGTVKGDTIAGTLTSQTKRGDTEPCVVQAIGTDCYNGAITGDVAATMGTPGSSVNASGPTVMQPVAMINMQGSKSNAVAQEDGPSYTLASMHGHDVHAIAYRATTGGNNAPLVMNSESHVSAQAFTYSGYSNQPAWMTGDRTDCLASSGHSDGSHQGIGIIQPVAVAFCPTQYLTSMAVRTANTQANGHGIANEVTHTLDGAQGQAVAIQDSRGLDKAQNGKGWNNDGASYTVDTVATQGVAFDVKSGLAPHGSASEGNVAFPSKATNSKDSQMMFSTMVVRRLTPMECERLQGFPDGHTDITVKNKPAADAPRYKALGNSMAVNCMQFLGERIQMVEDRHGRGQAS